MCITNEHRSSLPQIGLVKDAGLYLFDALAPIKFFTPGDRWTWYPIDFDGEDLCFGLIIGNVPELGYFRLSSLEQHWCQRGTPVIQDPRYRPMPVRDLLQKYFGLHIAAK